MPDQLLRISRRFAKAVDTLDFADPVSHVYNPLLYARNLHEAYLARYGQGRKRVVFLGMNPGPWGMAQTGIPFGEVAAVRDWMALRGTVGQPTRVHPKRPVTGLACSRSEVSGRRLWGAFAERFGSADQFFNDHFVLNYCPLSFMADSGRNITPDKLPADERQALFTCCDRYTRQLIDALDPEWVVGVGGFARQCCERLVGDQRRIGLVLHPSPASPAANRGWAAAAVAQLQEQGIWPVG